MIKNSTGKNKIIIKIGGGLGNQLFQYALGRNLALTGNKEVKFDLSWFNTYKERKYKLDHFNTVTEIGTKSEIKAVKKYGKKYGRLAFLHNRLFIDDSIYIKQKDAADFDPKIFQINRSVYLDGIWHSEKYFKQIEDSVRKEVKLKNHPHEGFEEIAERMGRENSVSLHVRRGDYLTMSKAIKTMNVCSIEYYNEAVKIIASKVKNPIFFVFSDDINWAKENLKLNFPVFFVSNKVIPDYEELILMSKCKHNIIANSSFSWWGAWLNMNHNKIVILPKNWFKDKEKSTKDIAPNNWIKI